MNKIFNVCFPKLGIKININPNIISIFGFEIRFYGVILGLSFLISAMLIFKKNKKLNNPIDKNQLQNLIIIIFIFGMIFARIYYVVFSPDLYTHYNKIKNVLKFNSGGIAIYGGFLGGLLSTVIYSKIKKINLNKILNLISPELLLSQALGRWGNFFNQESFGYETNIILGMSSEATNFKTIHPCFLYESIWCTIGYLIINLNKKIKDKFNFYILWYPAGRFFIEHLRSDSLTIIKTNIKISQLVSIILIILHIYQKIKASQQKNIQP